MGSIIKVVAVILALVYIGVAVWITCRIQSIAGSLGAAVGFLCGGLILFPFVHELSSLLCWAAVICLVITIVGLILEF